MQVLGTPNVLVWEMLLRLGVHLALGYQEKFCGRKCYSKQILNWN